MRNIGFCHSVLFKIYNVYTEKNIKLFLNCGCNAIEINCHHVKEIELINDILPFIKDFNYISLHAPCDVRYDDNGETHTLLKKLETFYALANAQLIVVHPDLVDDWRVFNNSPMNWAIENMDNRKEHYKNVSDLKNFFLTNPSWNLVLDVGHCNDNDKTMILAGDLIAEFKDRIKEIHLSGYEVFHDPLYRTKQTDIIDYCHNLDVPIIIESTFTIEDGLTGVEKEFNYITKNLK